jgi:hypothetical protein
MAALGAGASRADLQGYVRQKFGVKIGLDHISNCKGDLVPPRGLDDARERSVVVQSAVMSRIMVIIEVAGQDAFEMGFVEHDDMVEALPPDGCLAPSTAR